MNNAGKSTTLYRLVGSLLPVALLVQLLFPLHLHLRHAEEPEPHGHDHHLIDYHPVADAHASGDPAHQNDHELSSTPEALVKKTSDRDAGSLLLACLLLLLPLTIVVIRHHRSFPRNTLFHTLYYGLAPPLRAPPALLS